MNGHHTWEALSDFYVRSDQMPDVGWLVENLVPDAGRMALVAPPNAGKTWAALAIGRIAAKKGRQVFMVLEEGGVKKTAERFKALGFSASDPVSLVHLTGVRLMERDAMTFLVQAVKEAAAPVLVLDPLSSVFDGDENVTLEMNAFKEKLEQLMRANPALLLIVLHHTSKSGDRDGGSGIYAARGSSIFAGWADVQLNLASVATGSGSGVIEFDVTVSKMRDGERGGKKRCTIRLWEESPVSFEKSSESADGPNLRHSISAVLKASGSPMSKNEIAQHVGRNRALVLKTVDDMVSEGVVEKTAEGFRLVEWKGRP